VKTIANDYELIDTGGWEKLERFGQFTIRRPEPQAVWRKALDENLWQQADAWFRRERGKDSPDGNERGEWRCRQGMKQQWFVRHDYKSMHLQMRLGLTAFKHVGIFPEQAGNWNYIFDAISQISIKNTTAKPRVLNLFAYTGGASLAARTAGAEVTHVDSVRQTLTWANENLAASGMDGVRWVCEDALKFVRREARRGNRYNGLILDPPAYGRGPEGEKWVLGDNIAELMEACSQLLDKSPAFCVLNLYSMGFSPSVADNLLADYFPALRQRESGELFQTDRAGRRLPLSVFCRGNNLA
jgi:23S rRNA (cytosine1962-C5)-methyltransferase